MAGFFFDTSALVKAYHKEVGTERVLSLLADPGGRFLISSLAVVELRSALAQKLRSGILKLPQYQLACHKFGGDVRSKRLLVKGLIRRHQRAAEKLIATHAPTKRLRTLDALQLAIAVELNAAGTIEQFVVADEHLAEIAGSEGLAVINPIKP